MPEPRAVRISRPSGGGVTDGPARRAAFAGAWTPNRAAEGRAARLFGLFLGMLVVIYVVFLGIAELGTQSGARSAPGAWAVFSLVAVLLAGWGWWITYGRTPRAAQKREGDLLVRERLGRIRRFPLDTAAAPRVVQHYEAGWLGPEPTEFVELVTRERSRCTYLVGERFFEQIAAA